MKGLLLIVGMTALGTVAGLVLREHAPASTAEPPRPAVEAKPSTATTMENKPSAPRPTTVTRTADKGQEAQRLPDGSLQVTHYNKDGSRGMRITYGPTRANPSGPAAQPAAPGGSC